MIEKNVPIPPQAKGSGRPAKNPIGDLAVGDSVFIPNVSHISTQYWALKLGARYVKRIAEQDSVRGIRVWRIEP